jgi:hypothetical protein
VLYVARSDRPDRHHGRVIRVHRSPFAPPPGLPRDRAETFRVAYLDHPRRLWRADRGAFRDLIAQATRGRDLTLTDDWGDLEYALRRILAATPKQITSVERVNAVRRERERGRAAAGTVPEATPVRDIEPRRCGAGKPRLVGWSAIKPGECRGQLGLGQTRGGHLATRRLGVGAERCRVRGQPFGAGEQPEVALQLGRNGEAPRQSVLGRGHGTDGRSARHVPDPKRETAARSGLRCRQVSEEIAETGFQALGSREIPAGRRRIGRPRPWVVGKVPGAV